jgi:hypothetical protein
VSAAIKSRDAALVNDSVSVSRTLGVVSLPLRAPVITVDGRDVVFGLDLSGRDMPAGTRIFYTTDGTDPGVTDAGDPVQGFLYTGLPIPLQGTTGSETIVNARVYPPADYRNFFDASDASTTTVLLPSVTEVYVGGNFVNTGSSAMRNIARLNNSGQVDIRFDTGSGASPDSVIGIVRQTAAGIVAGGDFHAMNGMSRAGVARLHADGSVDSSFDAALSTN